MTIHNAEEWLVRALREREDVLLVSYDPDCPKESLPVFMITREGTRFELTIRRVG